MAAARPLVLLLGAEGARDELCAFVAPRIGARVLRTRDLAAAASDGDDAIGAQLRATFGAKKLAPASLLVALVARAVASDDGGGAGSLVDVLVDFPRSAGQLSQLERAAGRVAIALVVGNARPGHPKSSRIPPARPLRATAAPPACPPGRRR